MRFFGRSLIGLFLAAVTVGLLALAGQIVAGAIQARLADDGPGAPARERIFSANVIAVSPETITPRLTAYGEVRSRRTLELRSAAGGTIVELAPGFEDGATVTAGAVLIRIDPAEATSARDLAAAGLAEAEAELRSAEADIALARDDLAATERQLALRQQALTRQEGLRSRDLGSDAAVEEAALSVSSAEQAVLARRKALLQAEARVDNAASALTRARISLDEAGRALADTVVRAPFTGRLTGVRAVEGGIVSPNEVLAEIVDPDALEVMIRLSAAQAANLPAVGSGGTPFTVSMDRDDTWLTGRGTLTREAARIDEGISGRVVFGALQDVQGLLPGDFVTVTIEEPALSDVVMLPAAAVSATSRVLVLGPEDRLDEVPVEILRRQGDSVIVAAAPIAGHEVVSERSPLLGAGIRIRPVRPGAALADPAAPEFVELTEARRAALIAAVEAMSRMPADAKARVMEELAQDRVPAEVIQRIEARMGG